MTATACITILMGLISLVLLVAHRQNLRHTTCIRELEVTLHEAHLALLPFHHAACRRTWREDQGRLRLGIVPEQGSAVPLALWVDDLWRAAHAYADVSRSLNGLDQPEVVVLPSTDSDRGRGPCREKTSLGA